MHFTYGGMSGFSGSTIFDLNTAPIPAYKEKHN